MVISLNAGARNMKDYLAHLNEAQQQAVQHIEGPLMIIAGAGSGKTRVITYRIAYLLEQGVDPFNVLALTFTNKASREMRERIEGIVGTEARNIWMGTFHSVFAKILRFDGQKLGYPSNFTIYDTDDSKSLIKTLVKEEGLDPKLYKPNVVYGRISYSKNNFITPAAYNADEDQIAEDMAAGRPKLGRLYELYTKRCFRAGAMDFDDILINTYRLFEDYPDTLNKYQQKFRFVLVDEYQDTNYVQYLIVKKLAAVNRNICVVGDDAQSIYAFRGANIQNILNFEYDYPELSVYKLEKNYRSTKNIVKASSHLIKYNQEQLQKDLFTDNPEGPRIKVFKANSDSEEARLVAQSIFEAKMQHQLSNGNFAILYRTNAQSRSFEEALRRMSIPYQIIGGLSFYQRKEIKDLLAYYRLALNPDDEEALKRVINYPARGIGKTTQEHLVARAGDEGVSLWQVISHASHYLKSARIQKAVSRFADMIKTFGSEVEGKNAYDAGMFIAKNSGILKIIDEEKDTNEGKARKENVEELLSAMKAFTEEPDREEVTLGAFMADVALITDMDNKDTSQDAVTMMTVHGAKGLEFPYVYVVGLEENLFPSQMALQERSDLEEERRLFYVAVTRAQQQLTLSYATSRFRWGKLVYAEPSRFIEEIDPQYLDYDVATAEAQQAANQMNQEAGGGINGVSRKGKSAPKDANHHQPSKDFAPEDLTGLQTGMEVEHNRFGFGTVTQVDGEGGNRKAVVNFKNLGEKRILLKYAKMKILRRE